MRIRTSFCALALGAALPFAPLAHAQSAAPSATADQSQQQQQPQQQGSSQSGWPIKYPPPSPGFVERTLKDAAAYYTAPLRWNGRDWEYFGGALAAIAIAHHYDSQVRTHFDRGYTKSPLGPPNSGSITDALPGAALFLGTWGYATLIGSHAGKGEAWNMLEAGGLSFVSAYALKYVVRRARPDATTDPNHFFRGGTSFPSEHATAAFAVGTVFAESGNPRYRWIRRTIGYGVGIYTAYSRLKHNAHWLSDTVAGAALGMATAHFVIDRARHRREEEGTEFSMVPVRGGMMLAFSTNFEN
jgi:membrane-associated phospholipid phosphatase